MPPSRITLPVFSEKMTVTMRSPANPTSASSIKDVLPPIQAWSTVPENFSISVSHQGCRPVTTQELALDGASAEGLSFGLAPQHRFSQNGVTERWGISPALRLSATRQHRLIGCHFISRWFYDTPAHPESQAYDMMVLLQGRESVGRQPQRPLVRGSPSVRDVHRVHRSALDLSSPDAMSLFSV